MVQPRPQQAAVVEHQCAPTDARRARLLHRARPALWVEPLHRRPHRQPQQLAHPPHGLQPRDCNAIARFGCWGLYAGTAAAAVAPPAVILLDSIPSTQTHHRECRTQQAHCRYCARNRQTCIQNRTETRLFGQLEFTRWKKPKCCVRCPAARRTAATFRRVAASNSDTSSVTCSFGRCTPAGDANRDDEYTRSRTHSSRSRQRHLHLHLLARPLPT